MTDSLRDQLLGLGFKPAAPERRKPEPKRDERARGGKPQAARRQEGQAPSGTPTQDRGRPSPDTRRPRANTRASPEYKDHPKANANPAQREKDEPNEAQPQKPEQARQRREAKARLAELVRDKALNDPVADIARHFDYGGKIKRVYVTAAQLKALNAGDLGVIQLDGRYLLVDAAVLEQAAEVFAPAVALKVDPSAPAADDPYADPKFQVPDDLVW
jgi:uncharacterized protein YaiL (DUF2058 family)